MADGKQAIWTPDGVVTLGGTPLERVELRKGLAEWLRQFNDFAAHFGLGLHCAKCQKDVIGKNSDTDKTFSVACGCREFIGTNREYREPTTH